MGWIAMIKEFDVCIIGSGAGGSVASKIFAEKGWRVAIVEQGKKVAPGTNIEDVMQHAEKAIARDEHGQWGLNGYPWSASAVGGGTIFYAGVSFRYRDVDFDARNYVASDALDPKWPISYSDLDPYYNKIESWLDVSGDLKADPMMSSSSTGCLQPAHQYSQQGMVIAEASKRLGKNPFPTPLAVNNNSSNGYPACENLTSCTDYACPIGAKADSFSRILRPMLNENVVLMEQTKALRFIQNNMFRISELECLDMEKGEIFRIKAKQFILAANAIQSSALVLRSVNNWWPDGVGNKSGLVGAGLSFKVSEYVSGWVEDHPFDKLHEPLKGLYSTVSVIDHYLDSKCPSGLGGLIYEANPWTDYGNPGKGLYVQLESILADQPQQSNRVRLSEQKEETTGVPRIIIDYTTHDLDKARLSYMNNQTKNILREMGAKQIQCNPSYYYMGSAHLHGTCRAGLDENTSVVDKYGKFHTLDNLYVVDGSFMPFAGGVNPTLTIQANALRIAENIRL